MTVMAQNQQVTGNEAYTDIYKEYTDDPDVHIYTSNIDYTELATQITAGCTDDYQRVRAISNGCARTSTTTCRRASIGPTVV